MAKDNATVSVSEEHRAAERFEIERPIAVDGAPGITHNVSDMGICFESDVAPPMGAVVQVVLEYHATGETFRSHYEAHVVRVEKKADRAVVGARLTPGFFNTQESPASTP